MTVVGIGEAISGADGLWSLTVPQGRHVVTARKEGFEPAVSLDHGDNSMFVGGAWQLHQDFVLYAAGATGTVEVVTRDPITRLPRAAERWLYTAASAILVVTDGGGRAVITNVPAGMLLGDVVPRALEPGGTLVLDLHADGTAPDDSPQCAAGGIVYRSTTGLPVAGATITLRNDGAGFETAATSDANGRWSFAGGPTGEYEVTAVGGDGLFTSDAWRFDAQDDGWVHVNGMPLAAHGDDGALTIDEPASGSIVEHVPLVIRGTATLPKPGDYVVAAETVLSNGDVTAAPVVFEPDGRSFSVELLEFSGEGDQVLTVTAITRTGSFTHGNWATASIPLSLRLLPSLASLSLSPSEVGGGAASTAAITLDRPATPGGVAVVLASDNPGVATVPATVVVAEDAFDAWFSVTTLPVNARAAVQISATAGGVTRTATLAVNPIGPSSLSFDPPSVLGGVSSTGTVRLNAAAPGGGIALSLASDNPVATVPATATAAQGATTATFTVTTVASASASATITAAANGLAATGILAVTAPGILAGTVVSASGGQPVEGVTVATTAGGYGTTTDSAGAFALAVAPGAYTLSLTKAGWLSATIGPFTADAGQRTDGGTLPLTQGGLLSGRVQYYSQSSNAWKTVAGATVTVTGTSNSTATDSSGNYALTQAAGEWTLTAEKSYFVTATTAPVVLAAGQQARVDIFMDRYGAIYGRLVDSVTMAGVGGANATIAGGGFTTSQATREAGNFWFDAPSGQYTITFTKPGWEKKTFDASLCRDCLSNQGNVRFVRQGAITGTVTRGVDGAPIEGATVTVVGTSNSAITAPSGAFSIAQNPGTCTLAVTASGWAPKTTAPLTVVAGQTTDAGVIALDHGGSLTGTVLNGTDGLPLPDVTVTITETGEALLSDVAGTFAFANLTPGIYGLTLARAGWTTATRTDLAVVLGKTTDVGTVRLEQKGVIHGTVVSAADGTPIDGVTVTVTGTGNSMTTDLLGEFFLSQPVGNHTLTLARAGWATLTTAPLVVSTDGTTEAGVIALHQLGTIHGKVVSALNGAPVGAKVAVTGTSAVTVANSQTGEFSLSLPPGDYTLVFSDPWFVGRTTDPITVAGSQTSEIGQVALTMLGRITGRVVSEPSRVDLPDVTVAAPAIGRAVTASGEFTLPLPPGVHTLVVSRPGWLTRTIGPYTVASGQETRMTPDVVTLTAGGAIIGTVVDASDGAPVAGATVTVGGTGISATTDSAGAFVVSPAQGDYALTVTKAGWQAAATRVESVVKSHVTNVGLVRLSQQSGGLTGTVVSAADGSPIEGARVGVAGASAAATTDSTGTFTLTHLTGSWVLTVTKAGWASVGAGPFAVEGGQIAGVGAIALAQPAGMLAGTIVEPATGVGVPGAVVTVDGTTIATTTDATGGFDLSLAPGFVTLRATGGFGSVVSPILLVAAGATTSAGPLPLVAETGGLTGVLVDATSAAALASLPVTLSGQGRSYSTSTDADGRFRFLVAPGSYSLTRVGAVTVAAGETTDLGTRPATVGGTMVGSIGYSDGSTPLCFATVTAAGGSPAFVNEPRWPSPGGAGFVAPSPTGGGPITVSHADANQLTTPPVFVDYGLVTDAGTLSTSEYGTLSGSVHSPRGVAIGVETITINETGKRVESPYTHSCYRVSQGYNRPSWCAGHYTISERPGTYTLTIARHGYISQTTAPIQFADTVHTTNFNLVMQPAPGYDIASFTVNPASVVSGEAAVGEITLNGPMPYPTYLFDRTYVTLNSSNPLVAAVPAQVNFEVGEVSKTFPITTTPGGGSGPVTITATYVAGSVAATFTVRSEMVAALTLDPPAVRRGAGSTGTVTLDMPARASGVVVALASSDVNSATVPSSVTVSGGASSATFTVTTFLSAPESSVTISASCGGTTATAALGLIAPSLTGVAPGWMLPGALAVVAYGVGFDGGGSVELAGPVYDLADFTSPLCDVASAQCPSVTLEAIANADGTALTFAVPQNTAPGVYLLTARTAAGVGSGNSKWLAVDQAARVYSALTPEQHRFATAIHSGQTVTGTFTAGGDPDGVYSDFNAYYFIATAGSRVSASLERVDTARPWEHPDSLDPEFLVVAPDGYVYQNLIKYDDLPGTDLNASLNNAVLPQTGIYMVIAATSRGEGEYRLHFTLDAMAPATVRIVPLSDRAKTVRLGDSAEPAAIMLDPSGYPISGAEVSWSFMRSADDRGSSEFVGGATVLTGPDGSAQATVRAVGVGKVQYSPSFVSTFAASQSAGLVAKAMSDAVPRYQPVALRPFTVRAFYGGGRIAVSAGPLQRLDVERHHPRVEVRGRVDGGSALSLGAAGIGDGLRTGAGAGYGARPDASSAIPRPQALGVSAQDISSCLAGEFAMGNIDVSSVVTPLTLTLTDLTPSPGQDEPNGEIGIDGIHGHRIESTVDLKIKITDALGNEPPHPVLILLELGGSPDGKLILAPGIECRLASFLWHERDAQGTLVARNEEFKYQLGTRALYVGAAPDLANPGQVEPVWGAPEVLGVMADPSDALPDELPSVVTVPVHPEAGQPDRLLCYQGDDGQPCPDVFTYWSGYFTAAGGWNGVGSRRLTGGPLEHENAYFLGDRFGNTCFGYPSASTTPPATNVQLEFESQLGSSWEPVGYALTTTWSNDPAMPQGRYPARLSVSYPDDPEWAAGVVVKDVELEFSGGEEHLLIAKPTYERRLGIEDGSFSLAVAPAASGEGLPKGSDGTGARLPLLLLVGEAVSGEVGLGADEPSPEPGKVWRWIGGQSFEYADAGPPSAALEQGGSASFRLSLVDGGFEVVAEGEFVVHRCPKGDHQPELMGLPGCDLDPVASQGGVVASIAVNPGGQGDGGSRGYLGIELTRGPINPGPVFIMVESLGPTRYRIRQQAHYFEGRGGEEEHRGAFYLASVMGGEFLDENFQRVSPFDVNKPVRAYVRYFDSLEPTDFASLKLRSLDDHAEVLTELDGLPVRRLGHSSVFLSEALELRPVWMSEDAAAVHAMGSPVPALAVPKSPGVVAAQKQGQGGEEKAKCATTSGEPYVVLQGLRMPLSVGKYKGQENGMPKSYFYVCSPDDGDCPKTPEDPGQVTWTLSPEGVEIEGPDQLARMEKETRQGATPEVQWYIRGIRTTKGRVPRGADRPGDLLTLQGQVGALAKNTGTAMVDVRRPSHLGCCGDGSCTKDGERFQCKARYQNVEVGIEKLVLDISDEHGIPPQYLMAQVLQEAGVYPAGYVNAYAFRYEATSRDFKLLSGDWWRTVYSKEDQGMVLGRYRRLLFPELASFHLGIPEGQSVEHLPCEESEEKPCLGTEDDIPPPQSAPVELEPLSATVFRIPVGEDTPIRLGVKIQSPADLAQSFDGDCGTVQLGASQYCVDADARTVRFGVAPSTPPVARYRLVGPLAKPRGSLGDAIPNPEAALEVICRNNPSNNIVPCDPATGAALELPMTIRQWANLGRDFLIDEHWLDRYGERFRGDRLERLVRTDPSFDVPAQWFAAASYGLMQLIPEDFGDKVSRGVPEAKRQAIWDIYDPLQDSPVEKLFDPGVCVPLGAQVLILAGVATEDEDHRCAAKKTQCTWEHLWKRRLCVFNTGAQGGLEGVCDYSAKVLEGVGQYTPVRQEASDGP